MRSSTSPLCLYVGIAFQVAAFLLCWCWLAAACFTSLVGCTLIIRPKNPTLVVKGSSALLECSTSFTDPSVPVLWHCMGQCSTGKPTGDSLHVLFFDTLDEAYADHVTVVRNRSGQYDLLFTAVRESDAGNYTCADNHGSSGADVAIASLIVTIPAAAEVSSHRPPNLGQSLPTTTTTTRQSPTTSPETQGRTWMIVGIAVGVVIGSLVIGSLVIVAVVVGIRRRKRLKSSKPSISLDPAAAVSIGPNIASSSLLPKSKDQSSTSL